MEQESEGAALLHSSVEFGTPQAGDANLFQSQTGQSPHGLVPPDDMSSTASNSPGVDPGLLGEPEELAAAVGVVAPPNIPDQDQGVQAYDDYDDCGLPGNMSAELKTSNSIQ